MVYNHVARRVSCIVQKRLDALKIGQKMQDLPEELWHDSFKYYVKEDKNRKGGPNMRLIRLDPNKPSLTVTGFIFNKFEHPYENRYITVREAARLQGFPDDVEFKGTLTSTQQQVGNAVPVQLAKSIFNHICRFENNRSKKPVTAFSLFCGAGGMDIGAYQAKYDETVIHTRLAIDSWQDACDTLEGYLGSKTKILVQDVCKISNSLKYWKENTGLPDKPDLIYGGPPCQAFSQAGKQKSIEDPRGLLIFQFLRFIEEIHPKYFVMENVSNIKSVNKGMLYKSILNKMDELGYNVSEKILCAADYGAPQKRNRAIFIGTDKCIGQVDIPHPTHSETPTLFGTLPYVDVAEAFKGLPYLGTAQK